MNLTQRMAGFAIAGLALGCGQSGPRAHVEKVVPVSGVLTYNSQPLKEFMVTLIPPDGKRAATGTTDGDGKFVMGTNKAGDGAPTGLCKVAVTWVGPQANDDAGQGDIIDDPKKMPKPSVKIPAKYNNPETSEITVEVPAGGPRDYKLDLK